MAETESKAVVKSKSKRPPRRRLNPLGENETKSLPEKQLTKDVSRSRATLTAPTQAKVCVFYKDDDYTFRGLKVAVSQHRYKKLDALFIELSRKMPGLNYGVRSIFTPRGKDKVESFDHLTNNQKYICSTYRHTLKGLDIEKVDGMQTWHSTRPSSGRKELNKLVKDIGISYGKLRKVGKRDPQMAYAYYSTMPKKVTVMRNGDPTDRHVLIFNRRTAQTFDQVLTDVGETVKIAARRLFTMEGSEVRSLQQLFNGPDVLVVAGSEPFIPMDGQTPRQHSRMAFSRALIHPGTSDLAAKKIQARKERMMKTLGKWRVVVQTNRHQSAATQAQVTLVVYGHKGNSGPIALGSGDGKHFKAGAVDIFDVSVGTIGEIYKIRISHDNSGDNPGWLCDEVRMTDQNTDEDLTFECHRWLARDEDDSEICREMPAVRRGEPILPVLRYEVAAFTGNLWNAGTDANVYITIYGDRGDTGVRQLYRKDPDTVFNQGQEDTFSVEAVSLGQIKRIIIGHDGTGAGNGWYLEKIEIKEPKSKENYTFYCGKWLDEGEDDGKIVRELKVQEDYMDDIIEKRNWEHEMWKFQKDCEIRLYSLVTERFVQVKPNFDVDALGDSHNTSPGVFKVIPKKKSMVVMLQNRSHQKKFLAIDNGKVSMQGSGGPFCEFRVRIQHDRSAMFEALKNPLQFVTFGEDGQVADVRGLLDKDPTRRFHVYCKGMFRHRGIIILNSSMTQAVNVNLDGSMKATGQPSKLGHFRVHKVAPGGIRMFECLAQPGKYIRMKDGKIDCLPLDPEVGERDEYCHFVCDKRKEQGFVAFQSVNQRGLFIGIKPDGRIWPTVDTGVNNISFYPSVVEFGARKSKEMKALTMGETLSIENTPGDTPQLSGGEWKINVTTLEPLKNGEITLHIFGEEGSSGPISLGGPPSKPIFQAGNNDEFKASLKNIGDVRKIRLELSPKSQGKSTSWKVKDVELMETHTKSKLSFTFNQWLSDTHEDKSLMREMPAKSGANSLKLETYKVKVYTGKEKDADTDAEVYINLVGSYGDTGKRFLKTSPNTVKFQVGQVDTFELEAVDLGKLQQCIVGHNNTGADKGWYLDQIVVECNKKETVFNCDRWLDTSKDDRKIERTLNATK